MRVGRFSTVVILLLGFVLLPGIVNAQDAAEELQSIPSILNEMQSLWQLYSTPDLSASRGERIAEEIIQLRHRAGVRSHSALARAFAMRGWRAMHGSTNRESVTNFSIAVRLDPLSRELWSGYASAVASRNPLNFFEYLPMYFNAVMRSLGTSEGRYQFMGDFALFAGAVLVMFFIAWGIGMLLRHLRPLHFTLSELLGGLFTIKLSGIIVILLLGLPIVLGVELHWLFVLMVILTFPFQDATERVVTTLAFVIAWVGIGLISLSAVLAMGLTDPMIQSGFAAERQDSSPAMVNALERSLVESGVFSPQGIQVDVANEKRRDLFLYAFGKRKLGREAAAGMDLLNIFDFLSGEDSLGARALVNAANIRLERDDIRGAISGFERASTNPDAAPYALFNLWRVNYVLRNLDAADDLLRRLQSEHSDFAQQFDIENDELAPMLIDAGLTEAEIESIVKSGIARAAGSEAGGGTPLDIIVARLVRQDVIWPGALLLTMFVVYFLFRQFGIASTCASCGKIFSRHGDLDPKASSVCQACNSIRALNRSVDAELRRDQQKRQRSFRSRRQFVTFIETLLMPGLGHVVRNRTLQGVLMLSSWSVAAALVYSVSNMARAESLPYFSHWTPLSVLVIVVFALAAYISAFWTLYLMELQSKDGTQR